MLNFLKFLWPLIKELVLGEKSFKDALRTNKMRASLIILIFVSIITNFFAIPRIVSITRDHLELVKKYEALTKAPVSGAPPSKTPEIAPPQSLPPAAKRDDTQPAVPAVQPASAASAKKGSKAARVTVMPPKNDGLTPEERYKRLQDRFQRLKQQEENTFD